MALYVNVFIIVFIRPKTPAEQSQIVLCRTDYDGKMKEACCVQHRISPSLLEYFILGTSERGQREIIKK